MRRLESAIPGTDRRIGLTKKGLVLLIAGTLTAWIPDYGYGVFLIPLGAILVILSSPVFGSVHSRNALLAVALAIVGFLGGFVAALAVGFALAPGPLPRGDPKLLEVAFDTTHASGVVAGAIAGLAPLFLTYALQKPTGRFLLWAAYAANLSIQSVVFIVMRGALTTYISTAISSGRIIGAASLGDFESQFTSFALLGAIPAGLYASAYYLAWLRITQRAVQALPA